MELVTVAAFKLLTYRQLEKMIEQLYGWRSVLFYDWTIESVVPKTSTERPS